jgi:hypothetical protein
MGPFMRVDGSWEMVQRNGFRILVDIDQDEDRVSAFASHSQGSVRSLEAVGFVRGPNFEITITWDNGTKGKYTGVLSHGPFTPPPIGFLKGDTVDLTNPATKSIWESEGRVFQIA